jgi:hypothetical protein
VAVSVVVNESVGMGVCMVVIVFMRVVMLVRVSMRNSVGMGVCMVVIMIMIV